MKKLVAVLTLVSILTLSAAAKNKETSRVENAGEVMTAILNVPDDIPQSLFDKADCVIVLPSVLKIAIGIGGNYGRGVMTCRTNNFKGPWGPPTMMALEGGSFGLQLGGQATDFVLLVMNEGGANGILTGKVKLGADAPPPPAPKDVIWLPLQTSQCARKFSAILVPAGCSQGSRWKAQPFDRIMAQTSRSMVKKSTQRR